MVQKWVGGGGHRGTTHTQTHTHTEADPENKTVFVIEKYVKDVKQGQKMYPDLLESIMKPTDHAEEELRLILCKMIRFCQKSHILGF